MTEQYKDFQKRNYIKKISTKSDRYRDKLLKRMEKYNKFNLRDISFEEAKEFWEELENEMLGVKE